MLTEEYDHFYAIMDISLYLLKRKFKDKVLTVNPKKFTFNVSSYMSRDILLFSYVKFFSVIPLGNLEAVLLRASAAAQMASKRYALSSNRDGSLEF